MNKNTANKLIPFAISGVALIITLSTIVISAAVLAYKLASEKAYKEKWKDYDDCGLA